MRGAIIYFSGTGNTEHISKLFKKELESREIECSVIDTGKKKKIIDNYDFFILGCPIHAEVFPDIFMEWVDKNLILGKNRRCIIFSTQAAKTASGAGILSRVLNKRGFNVVIQDCIEMPNNYYVVAFHKNTEDEVKSIKEVAEKHVEDIVDKFINNRTSIRGTSKIRQIYGEKVYKIFLRFTKNWARKRLSVDMDKCVKCGKCVKNCPTHNISLRDNIIFKSNCISCQKCIHSCPVNAFRYKNNTIEQYKL